MSPVEREQASSVDAAIGKKGDATSLSDALDGGNRLRLPSVPSLRKLMNAVDRVHERWKDTNVTRDPRERDRLAYMLSDYVSDWPRNWPSDEVRLSFVLAAASAVFDEERRERADLEAVRIFLYRETGLQESSKFLFGMLRVYIESYAPESRHSRALSKNLRKTTEGTADAAKVLLSNIPEILDSDKGHDRLAARMCKMDNPFQELRQLGLRSPHGEGIMDFAHVSFSDRVQEGLVAKDKIDDYFSWLRPGGGSAWERGAVRGVEALIHPWLRNTPDDSIRSHLVETLIDMYGDPRIHQGGIWTGVADKYMRVIQRWLTKEEMQFFIGVVNEAQTSDTVHMWEARRDFWLELYEDEMIDAAWVAFSERATKIARDVVNTGEVDLAYDRFGWQRARTNTSLLIMRIGDKIVVDGCHSYKTHVFDHRDPMAPELFGEGYDCNEIMDRSPASKPHNSIPSWKVWVRNMINADVAYSKYETPYSDVIRPTVPKPFDLFG